MDINYVHQFKRGAMEMVLLSLIDSKEYYGYELIKKLNEVGGRVFVGARYGTVYPILYRLEENGFIKSRPAPSPANGGEKKMYSLTDKGRQLLGDMKYFWGEYVDCVNSFLDNTFKDEQS